LLAVLSFAGVFIGQGYWWLALVMAVFSFFWNAALPQFEATTLNHLGSETQRYSSIRLWGSIGFILAVSGLGVLFEQTGTGILPQILLLLFAGIWLASLLVPENAAGHQKLEHETLGKVLARPPVLSLFAVCFLVQASHGPYYTFYSLYLSEYGYTKTMIGQLWALGVIAEIGVFLRMHRWLPAFGARQLLLSATLLTVLRWLLIAGFVEYAWVMVVAQVLHAASFGIYHAVAIHLVHGMFTGPHQGRGQALYSSLSFGAGGALGSFAAGYLWEGFGAQLMYTVAAGTAAIAAIIVWRSMLRE
jgi:PPP family 3-phenylpropionic acid transporter